MLQSIFNLVCQDDACPRTYFRWELLSMCLLQFKFENAESQHKYFLTHNRDLPLKYVRYFFFNIVIQFWR
jgi:hypothetical protein